MFNSPHDDIAISDASVYDDIFATLQPEDLEQVALIDGLSGAETTYGQLRTQVDAFAGALAARGVTTETVVALLCPNVPAFAAAFHGTLRAGATVTTLNSLYTPAEIVKQLRDSKAEWFITVSPLLPGAKAAAAEYGIDDDHLIVLDGAEGHPDLRTLLGEGHAAPDVSFDSATHVAVLPYSSGTTGIPKGVMLSHRNLVANVAQSRVGLTLTSDDRVMAVLPFFHIYGMTVLLNVALRERATLITMPRFDLEQFLTTIQEQKATFLFVAPPIVVALAKHPMVDQFDITTVRGVFSGAAPLDGETAQAAATRINARVVQGYGMTEMSPVSHASPLDGSAPISSIGPAVPNCVCKIVGEDGNEVAAPAPGEQSEPGELWVKGPNIMLGYLGRPDATAETLDVDGFLHTGDLATIDSDGNFYIVDRVKELIKYKGYQVAPAELEALLLSHPKIMDAACIGVNDAEGEEVPKAFVVAAPESGLTADEVMSFVAEHVAPYKKVRQVQFIDVIPKSASGKILRKDLRVAWLPA